MAKRKKKQRSQVPETKSSPFGSRKFVPPQDPSTNVLTQPSAPDKASPSRKEGTVWTEFWKTCADAPLLPLQILFALLFLGWVVLQYARPLEKATAVISGRSVSHFTTTDDEGYVYHHYSADISSVYQVDGADYPSALSMTGTPGKWFGGFDNLSEASNEAIKWRVGEEVPIFVDAADPRASYPMNYSRPIFAPLLILGLFTFGWGGFWYLSYAYKQDNAPRSDLWWRFRVVPIALLGWVVFGWFFTSEYGVQPGEAAARKTSLTPLLARIRSLANFTGIPKEPNKEPLSFEEHIKKWGRPDVVEPQMVDSGHQLVLTYWIGTEWKQAWRVDFQFAPEADTDPLPIGPPYRVDFDD